MLSLAFLAIAGIGGWPNGGQAKAIGAILASRQALGPNNSSWICKNIAARISLEAGRSPASSQCGRLKPRGLNVKASTQTKPRYWPVARVGCTLLCVQSTAGGEGSGWTLILYSECGLK